MLPPAASMLSRASTAMTSMHISNSAGQARTHQTSLTDEEAFPHYGEVASLP